MSLTEDEMTELVPEPAIYPARGRGAYHHMYAMTDRVRLTVEIDPTPDVVPPHDPACQIL